MEASKTPVIQLIFREQQIVPICCLCFKNIENEDDCFSVQDSVMNIDGLLNNNGIDLIKILENVLGMECVGYLSTEILCRYCVEMSIKCYKFINSCKENLKYTSNVVKCLDELCSSEQDVHDFKTMYLTIDTRKFNGVQYFDHRSVDGDCSEALKIFESISNHKEPYGIETENGIEEVDNTQMWTKARKKKQRHVEDLMDKINITEILYDKNNTSLHKCKECRRQFPNMHNLKRHFIRLHAPKDYACSKCSKSFGSPAILEEHRQITHSGKKVICIECGKKYASIKSLKLHELSHKLILKCDACGKIFNRQRNYNVHVTSKRCEVIQNRSNVEKRFICDYCNKRYACKGTLRVHIQFEHGNGCHHICSWCGKKFCSLAKLKAHTVTHTQEKNFSCEICGGCYVTKESLLYHTRRHTGEKPFQCEHCDQRFLSSSRRAEHIRRHHMDPSIECDVCHIKFRGRSCLLRHKKRHFDPNSRLHYTKLADNEV